MTKTTISMLPELDLASWEQSKKTLHLFLQIVGKVQLSLMPRKNHWWNATLLLNSKGLVTHLIPGPAGDFNFEIQFNFQFHRLEIITSNGMFETFSLENGLSVADFYQKLFDVLAALKIYVRIIAKPYSFPDSEPLETPFALLKDFNSYDARFVSRFWNSLIWVNQVFVQFSGRFYGKTSPVQLFWHHMDLAVTRFSGRRASCAFSGANISTRDAYSHELISFGFWVGDDEIRSPAFYSYCHPSPSGIEKKSLQPAAAKWVDSNGIPMALLMYNDIRSENNPEESLLDFLESCYVASAKLAYWNIADLRVDPLDEI